MLHIYPGVYAVYADACKSCITLEKKNDFSTKLGEQQVIFLSFLFLSLKKTKRLPC